MYLGSRTFVTVSWMCKKQASVSHNSTAYELIAFDALDTWDIVIEVLRTTKDNIQLGHTSSGKLEYVQPNSSPHDLRAFPCYGYQRNCFGSSLTLRTSLSELAERIWRTNEAIFFNPKLESTYTVKPDERECLLFILVHLRI